MYCNNFTHTHTHTFFSFQDYNILQTILMHVPWSLVWFLLHRYISIFFSLYNAHSCMFRHLYVILREVQNLYFAKLHKFLKLKLLKLHFNQIIGFKYYLLGRWVVVCSVCDVTISCDGRVFMWLHIHLWYIYIYIYIYICVCVCTLVGYNNRVTYNIPYTLKLIVIFTVANPIVFSWDQLINKIRPLTRLT
jgi:hypothetical protein